MSLGSLVLLGLGTFLVSLAVQATGIWAACRIMHIERGRSWGRCFTPAVVVALVSAVGLTGQLWYVGPTEQPSLIVLLLLFVTHVIVPVWFFKQFLATKWLRAIGVWAAILAISSIIVVPLIFALRANFAEAFVVPTREHGAGDCGRQY